MISTRLLRRAKLAALATFLAGGTVLGSACTAADMRHNILAGTQAFVRGYTTELWVALVPPAEDLINLAEEED